MVASPVLGSADAGKEEDDDLVMEALRHIIVHMPDWLRRLDELNGQIEQRQQQLAQLTGSQSETVRSVKKIGSTESLRPRDEPAAYPCENTAHAADEATGATVALAVERQQVREAGQACARAAMRTRQRQRTDSIISIEGAATQYRTRSMIIVYYDSYVQSLFEELVKFVSASRNKLRKAKMAAKVARIKRLAEVNDAEGGKKPAVADGPHDQPDTMDVSGADKQPAMMSPTGESPHMDSRPLHARDVILPTSASTERQDIPDVYGELDKGLEYVQCLCEHAAHQFLRDGDCTDEVAIIQRRMSEARELAEKEMERIMLEEPYLVTAAGTGEAKSRSYRPQSMRMSKDATYKNYMSAAAAAIITPALEVDEDGQELDEDELKKLVYKDTGMLR